MKRLHILTNKLRELYWDRGMSMEMIAEELGCSATSIARAMKRCGIPRRSISEAQILKFRHKRRTPIPTKEELELLYVNQRLSCSEVGKKLGILGSKVRKWLVKYGIKRRTAGEQNSIRTWPSRILPTKEKLEKLYHNEKLSAKEIGERLGVSKEVIKRLLRAYGIRRRLLGEAMLRFVTSIRLGKGDCISEDNLIDYILKNPDEFGYEKVFINRTSSHDLIGVKRDGGIDKIEVEVAPGHYKRYHVGDADLIISYYNAKTDVSIPYRCVSKEKFIRYLEERQRLGIL